MWFSGFFFLILSLIVDVYLWWKLQASLIFLSGRTCTIGGWLNTFFPPLYIYIYILYICIYIYLFFFAICRIITANLYFKMGIQRIYDNVLYIKKIVYNFSSHFLNVCCMDKKIIIIWYSLDSYQTKLHREKKLKLSTNHLNVTVFRTKEHKTQKMESKQLYNYSIKLYILIIK